MAAILKSNMAAKRNIFQLGSHPKKIQHIFFHSGCQISCFVHKVHDSTYILHQSAQPEPPFVLFNVLQFAYREFHKRVICLKQAITHIDIVPHISLTIEYVLT